MTGRQLCKLLESARREGFALGKLAEREEAAARMGFNPEIRVPLAHSRFADYVKAVAE